MADWFNALPDWGWNSIVFLSAWIIGFFLKTIIRLVLRYYRNSEDYSIIRSVVLHLSPPLTHFAPLFVLNLMMPLLRLEPRYFIPLERVVEVLLMISFAVLLLRSIRILEDYIYSAYNLEKADNLKERKIRTQLQFIRKVAVVLIVLITVSIILLSFDNVRKIGAGLLTGVGIGGIIIGFAAQKSLGNFLAGFQIAFTQPIRIDDVLIVEGEYGRVEEITLTYVVLNLWDQRRLILPINYFIEKPFQNWTRSSSEILGTVFLYVDHTAPIENIRAEFDRLLDNTPLWDRRVKVLQVTDVKESTVEIRALMSAQNSGEAFDLRCFIREGLVPYIRDNHLSALPKTRLEIPEFASQTEQNV